MLKYRYFLLFVTSATVSSFYLPKQPTFTASNVKIASIGLPEVSESSFSQIPQKICVAGATGRTGIKVVEELLDQGKEVVALVRDLEKAKEKLPCDSDEDFVPQLTVRICDLNSEKEIRKAVDGCDAAIWCATGFSNAPNQTLLTKLAGFMGLVLPFTKGIDIVGVSAIARALSNNSKENETKDICRRPKFVMLSSAGVTRPQWSDEKKKKLEGCAAIPIVRLNPFGILDLKAESEDVLRTSGVDYCIFRPTGLNEDWPAEQRPIFSQGDVAVGRINRKDVAKILVQCIDTPEAVGKTFEAFSLEGYPPPKAIGKALENLRFDTDGAIPEEVVEATYFAMQQLLPGEKQDAASLAMGQTYEQLDRDETGRLGERGKENAELAAPKPSL